MGFKVANLRRNLVLLSLIPTSNISWGKYSLSKSLSLSITWTADVDSTIVRMRTDGDSFAKIASELGDGLKDSDIKNRWTRHLKDKEKDIIIRLIIIISLMLDGMVSIQIMDNSHHYNYLRHCTSSCPIFVSSSD